MPRYIDADALKAKYEQMLPEIGDGYHKETLQDVLSELEYAPTVSPDEVRGVGKWLITDAYPHRVYCSVCYKTYLPNADWELWSDGRIPRNFCPQCGAKMKGVSEDA